MFTLTIQAATADELRQKVADAQPKTGSPLAVFTSETLLEELRSRFRKDGLVVNVEPFASVPQESSGETPQADKATKTKKNAKAEKAEEKHEEPKPVDPNTMQAGTADPADKERAERNRKQEAEDRAKAAAEQKADAPDPAALRAQVVAALDSYAKANGGQVAARQVMQRVGGSIKLADIPTDKWPELIEALTVKEAA